MDKPQAQVADDALIRAASGGDARTAALLLTAGASAKAFDKDGHTALTLASCFGHAECVELLLPHSDPLATDRFGRTPLLLAALLDNPACLLLLLPHFDPAQLCGRGYSPLMGAATGGHRACVEILLAHDPALARMPDPRGLTALMCAVANGHLECTELLLPHSDIWAATFDGQTALCLARERNSSEGARLILAEAARLEARAISLAACGVRAIARKPRL